jgi:hypothetical protein
MTRSRIYQVPEALARFSAITTRGIARNAGNASGIDAGMARFVRNNDDARIRSPQEYPFRDTDTLESDNLSG